MVVGRVSAETLFRNYFLTRCSQLRWVIDEAFEILTGTWVKSWLRRFWFCIVATSCLCFGETVLRWYQQVPGTFSSLRTPRKIHWPYRIPHTAPCLSHFSCLLADETIDVRRSLAFHHNRANCSLSCATLTRVQI